MNTSDTCLLASQAPSSPWPLKLKSGPHQDLLTTCDFSDSVQNQDDNDLINKSVGRLLHKALSAKDVQERVAAARQCIESSNGSCGLAWLVLAREGVNSPESAMIYSQRAIDRIKQELHDSNFGEYCLYNSTYTIALADAAEMAFNAGRKRDATEMLRQQLDADVEDELWSDCQIILRDQLASLLIQMGEAKEAQTFLYSHPDNIEAWHYLNALAHYVISGDCLTARSALACAFKAGTVTAQKLLGSYSIFEHNSDQFDQAICIEKAAAAWLNNEDARGWLKNVFQDANSVVSRESIAIAIQNKDKKRWQLWDSRETSAAYFMDQESYKEAAKEFKAALREAERIDYSHFPFLNTITGLLALHEEVEFLPLAALTKEELRQKIDARVERFNPETFKNDCHKDALLPLHFQSFATIYKALGDLEAATTNLTKAMQLVQNANSNSNSNTSTATALSLAEIVEIQQTLAELLYEQSRYPEALMHCRQVLGMQEQYLGATHFDELATLELAHDCCQQLGDQAGAEALAGKMKAIDPFALG
jgi:hypothetical protein